MCYDCGRGATARRGGGGDVTGNGPPHPFPRLRAGSSGELAHGNHGAAGATTNDEAPPEWDQLRGRPGSAP
jgi:hypothetical protein